MRLVAFILALWATIAFAQQQNAINTPQSGFDVVAGQPITITWANPSSGTVTIRLTQGSNLAPGSGEVLIANVPASSGTATFVIPTDVNTAAYNFEIVDDTNANNVNFSSAFTVSGGSQTASSSSSGTSSASSSTNTSNSSSTTGTSSSTMTSESSSTTHSSTTTHSSSSSASRTSASASATSVAANSASYAKAGGMLAIMAGAVAVF